MSHLGDALSKLPSPREPRTGAATESFFETFGLAKNPFPTARTIWPDVLYDQQAAAQRVAGAVEDILVDTPARTSVGILGGTGQGKTHFLSHARWLLADFFKRRGVRFAIVSAVAGTGKIQSVIACALEAADAACQAGGSADLVTALVDGLRSDPNKLKTIGASEVRLALGSLVAARAPGYKPKDKTRRFDFETLLSVFRRWILGTALDAYEKKYLGVSDRISTGSMGIRTLTELFALARVLGALHGMVLCVDEMETLFAGGQKMAFVQGFLLDLRYLFDEAGGRYSLLVLSASTPHGADSLFQINQPLYQRLGLDSAQRVLLRPIEGTLDAKSFAMEYLTYCHEQWKKDQVSSGRQVLAGRQPGDLLSDKDIAEAYQAAAGTASLAPYVSQSALLEALHRLAAQKQGAAGAPAAR